MDATFLTPANALLIGGSLALAVLVLWYARKNELAVSTRVFLIYVHIALLIVPVALLSYSSGCAMEAYSCTGKAILYAAPFIIGGIVVATGIAGYFLLPLLYRRRFGVLQVRDRSLSAFTRRHALKRGLRVPAVHIIDNAAPIAFSFSAFRPAIFVSVGLLELLTRNQVKAVLLHELGHLVQRSSVVRVTSWLAHLFSPFARVASFRTILDHEECAADGFAARIQGTMRHIRSARRKVEAFSAQRA